MSFYYAAAATVGGALIGSAASRSAGAAQADAATRAQELQQQQYADSVARSKPFYDTSVNANNKLSSLLGLDGSSPDQAMMKDPGYQFRFDEGQRGVENSAAARGGLLSGGTMKAIAKYGQGFASNEYGNVYNRLSNTAGGGQVANGMNNMSAGYANQQSNLMGAGASAYGAGQVGQANAWSNGIGQGINNYQFNQMLPLLKNRGTSSGSGLDSNASLAAQYNF